MPVQEGVRLDDLKLDEEQPIPVPEQNATADLALQDHHLLPQSRVLRFKPELRLERCEQQPEQKDQ
jgi:hypothetical protein